MAPSRLPRHSRLRVGGSPHGCGITEASQFEVPLGEYESWIAANGIEVLFLDQNYQFEELTTLRRNGTRIVGRFVWEHFAAEHVDGALEAYDLIYSMTRAEQAPTSSP